MDKYTGAAEWKPAASSADTSELDTAMGSLNVGASEWNPTTLASQAQEWVPPGAGAPNVGYGNTVASGGAYGGYGGYGGYGAGGAAYQQPAAMPMFPPQASQQFYAGQPAAWPAQQQADVDERDEHAMIQEELNKQFLREQNIREGSREWFEALEELRRADAEAAAGGEEGEGQGEMDAAWEAFQRQEAEAEAEAARAQKLLSEGGSTPTPVSQPAAAPAPVPAPAVAKAPAAAAAAGGGGGYGGYGGYKPRG